MNLATVRFLRPSSCYTPGDVARLPWAEAERLASRQVVVRLVSAPVDPTAALPPGAATASPAGTRGRRRPT